MSEQNQQLETLQDIKRIMERSSRFLSLSGLSGIAAGICALAGSFFAYNRIMQYYNQYNHRGFYEGDPFQKLKYSLFVLAGAVLAFALITAFYFTWRRAKKSNVSVWDHTSKKLFINMLIPLVAGGLFILAMLQYNEWRFVAPASLIFYGIALVNASKYTLTDVRYLGVMEILLGLINTQFIGYGLYFWAFGFGVLHITYGAIMWWKYERV
ncbi:MAG: hypothetical protein M3O67_00095 [Bacteroidota bacterium]|nr:hypothetical protein [Bacteroidota bacterium]